MPPKKKPKAIGFHPKFKIPSREDQLNALHRKNSPKNIPPELFPYEDFFPPIPIPVDIDDWLHQYDEEHETFEKWSEYFATEISRSRGTKSIVYLRPIGEFEENQIFGLDKLRHFVELFYPEVSVKLLPALKLDDDVQPGEISITYQKITRRGIGPTLTKTLRSRICHPYHEKHAQEGDRQFAVDPLLRVLFDTKPADAFCVIGVTMEDLYEGDEDSFVVGMANGGSGDALFSFARYDPAYGQPKEAADDETSSKKRKSSSKKKKVVEEKIGSRYESEWRLLLARSCKVLVHELAHLYGIGHCSFFSCCMNGSGHLEEDYSQPLHFCPVDLMKLQAITKCDLLKRYEKLFEFYTAEKLLHECEWVEKLIARIAEDREKTQLPSLPQSVEEKKEEKTTNSQGKRKNTSSP